MIISGEVGPSSAQSMGPGATPNVRLGQLGDVVVSELHGRYYEANYRGAVFSDGMGLTSINNATFTTGTLGATVTPIAGVWNPSTSTVNLVIMQAIMGITVTAATATGGGPFVWAASTGNGVVSTGNNPLNRRTLVKSGSQAKGLCGVAPTGLTNNLTVLFGSQLLGGLIKNISSVETAVGQNIGTAGISIEHFDGDLIVPPGGALALLATTTPVAHSAVSAIVWEEVPL